MATRLKEYRAQYEEAAKRMHAIRDAMGDGTPGEEELREFDELAEKVGQLEKKISVEERCKEVEAATTLQEENREHAERELAERSKESFHDDLDAPLNGMEIDKAVRCWLRHGDGTEHERELMRRAGFSLDSREVVLNTHRGFYPNGSRIPEPRSMQEALEQARARREMPREYQLQCARECQQPGVEMRAQNLSPKTAGGHLVVEEIMAELDKNLVAFGDMRRVADVWTTQGTHNLKFPTVNDATNVGEIIGESAENTEQDVVFAEMKLGAYKVGSKMVRVSFEMLQDDNFGMPRILGDLLGERVARGENVYFTTGTGTNQPTGIVTAASNSSVVGATGTPAVSTDNMIDLRHSVDPAYRASMGGRSGYMMHDQTLALVKKMKDSENRPLWQASLIPSEPSTFDGEPIFINQQMATPAANAKGILYGDYSKFKIRQVLGFTLLRSPHRYFEFNQEAFLGYSRVDSNLVNTNAVKYFSFGAAS